MLSSSSVHTCVSPFSNSNLEIPSTNYSHSMRVVITEPEQKSEVKLISIELQVQEWYKVYVEAIRGYRMVTMEEEYLVSPKFTCKFKLSLFLSIYRVTCGAYIEEELDHLSISPGLAHYLKPFIVDSVFGLPQTSPAEFKLLFDVKVIKIDLANYQECDSYRRQGLV